MPALSWILIIVGGAFVLILLRWFVWWYYGIYEAFDRMDETNKLLKEISAKLGEDVKVQTNKSE